MGPEVWDGVRPHLEAVRPVLAPQLVAPRAAEGAQAELAAEALTHLPDGDGGLHVVGHSFGGQVAIEVALLVPERIRSLTILCSRAAPFPAFAAAAAAVRRGDPVDIDGALDRWLTPEQIDADGPVVAHVRRCLGEVDRTLWADELDAIATYDRMHDVSRITAPTTVIAAELDQVGTVEHLTELTAAIPEAELHVLPSASHLSPFTDPAALASRLVAAAARTR
jgi:pimeloyl-ACP methyl ester carboxylesterase